MAAGWAAGRWSATRRPASFGRLYPSVWQSMGVAPINESQLDVIRAGIRSLSSPSIAVTAVTVEDVDGTEGPGVLVTVRLTSTDAEGEWDAHDFLAIRRQARTVAVEALPGQDVRLVYESDAPGEEAGDEGGAPTLEQDS